MFVNVTKIDGKYLRWAVHVGWLGWRRAVGLGVQFWLTQPAVRLTVFGVEITGGRLAKRETIRGDFGKDGWWKIDTPDRKYLDEVLAKAQKDSKPGAADGIGGRG